MCLRPGPVFTDKMLADAMADELGLTRYLLLGVDTSIACADFEPDPDSLLRWRITADAPLPRTASRCWPSGTLNRWATSMRYARPDRLCVGGAGASHWSAKDDPKHRHC